MQSEQSTTTTWLVRHSLTHSPFQRENNSNRLFLNNCLSRLLCESMSCLLKSEVKWLGKQFYPQWTLALFFSHKLQISFISEQLCTTSQHVCGYWGWNQEDHKLLEKPEKISTLLALSISSSTAPLVNIIHLREFKLNFMEYFDTSWHSPIYVCGKRIYVMYKQQIKHRQPVKHQQEKQIFFTSSSNLLSCLRN